MKYLINFLLPLLVISACALEAKPSSREPVSIAIDGMKIDDFIKYVSRISNKNIFMGEEIVGKVSYVGTKSIRKEDLFMILQTTLETRGFTMIDSGAGYYSIVKSADVGTMNVPFLTKTDIPQMQTEVIDLKHAAAESMGAKLKNFSSKSGKIIASKESNSVVITDLPSYIKTMRKLASTLDVRDETTANVTHLIQLKNSDSKALAATLNTIIPKMILAPGQQPPSITSDDSTNSIIVISSDDLYRTLLPTIKDLDAERQQVYVKAKIIEISESKAREVGLKYGFTGGAMNPSGLFTFNSQLGDGKTPAVNIDPLILSKFTIPNLSAGIALGVNLALLNKGGAANILSEPSILCIDNLESSIYVGKTESINSGTTISGTGLSQANFTRQDIGLTLKIKPRLSNDNKVMLSVDTKLEDVDASTTNLQLPSTTKREVKTSAIVSNGESVIIGGLIRDKVEFSETKVPFLGDLPLVGALFRSKSDAHDKINLVIILTPYIMDKSTDLTALRSQLGELDKIQQTYIDSIKKNDE